MPDNDTPDDDDFGPLHTPVIVTIGAFMLMTAGLFTAAGGLQLLSLTTVYTVWVKPIPYLMALSGVAGMGIGGVLSGGRFWAAMSSIPVALLMMLLGAVWTVWALMAGFFSLLPLFAAFLSFVALLVLPFGVAGAKRVTEARARLMA